MIRIDLSGQNSQLISLRDNYNIKIFCPANDHNQVSFIFRYPYFRLLARLK
jgi:hypothetical protein